MRVVGDVETPKLLSTVTLGSSDLRKVAESSVENLLEGKDTTFLGSVSSFGLFRSSFLDILFSTPKFKDVPRTTELEGILTSRYLHYANSYAESNIYPHNERTPLCGGLVIVENDSSTVDALYSRDIVGELEIYHLTV